DPTGQHPVNMPTAAEWLALNEARLGHELARVRRHLARHTGIESDDEDDASDDYEAHGLALDAVCEAFGLTAFERDVLLLCAGCELDSRIAAMCTSALDARPRATFGLALGALPGAHWSAVIPASPLRYWRLVEVEAGAAITTLPIRI